MRIRVVRSTEYWCRLKKLFQQTVDHFNLSPDECAAAWESACDDPSRAMECYSTIVRSLKGTK